MTQLNDIYGFRLNNSQTEVTGFSVAPLFDLLLSYCNVDSLDIDGPSCAIFDSDTGLQQWNNDTVQAFMVRSPNNASDDIGFRGCANHVVTQYLLDAPLGPPLIVPSSSVVVGTVVAAISLAMLAGLGCTFVYVYARQLKEQKRLSLPTLRPSYEPPSMPQDILLVSQPTGRVV